MTDKIPAAEIIAATRLQLDAERAAVSDQGTDDQRRAAEKRAAAWADRSEAKTAPAKAPSKAAPEAPKAKAERHTRRTA